MKLAIKVVSVMILLALLSPVILLKGCGEVIDGGQCGGCPDSAAPTGSSITASTLNAASTLSTDSVCYATVTFQVFGPDGTTPLNNACIEIYTDGYSLVGEHTPDSITCNATTSNSYMRIRTDDHGVVTLNYWIPDPCAGRASGTKSTTFSVWAISCAATDTASATISITDVDAEGTATGCP